MSSIGHNSGGIAEEKLCSMVRRLENLDEEIATLNADKSEVYKEAKGLGFDVPALRALIAERKKKAKDAAKFEETCTILDLYRDAVERGTVCAPARVHVHEEA